MTKKRLIDRTKLKEVSVDWHKQKLISIEKQEELPKIPEFVGEAIVHIATRYLTSYRYSHIPAHVKDDMISNAVLAAVRAFANKYDPAKTASGGDPFSFLTTAVRFGYLNAINKSMKDFNGQNTLLAAIMDGVTSIDTGTHHSLHVEHLVKTRTKIDNFKLGEMQDEKLAERTRELNEKRSKSNDNVRIDKPDDRLHE